MTPCFSSGTQNNDILSTSKMKNSSSFDEGGGAAPAISVVTGTPKNFSTSLHFSENPSLPGPHQGRVSGIGHEFSFNRPSAREITAAATGKTLLLQKGATAAADSRHFFTRTHTHTQPSAETPRIDRRTESWAIAVARFTGEPRSLSFFVRFGFSSKKNRSSSPLFSN